MSLYLNSYLLSAKAWMALEMRVHSSERSNGYSWNNAEEKHEMEEYIWKLIRHEAHRTSPQLSHDLRT